MGLLVRRCSLGRGEMDAASGAMEVAEKAKGALVAAGCRSPEPVALLAKTQHHPLFSEEVQLKTASEEWWGPRAVWFASLDTTNIFYATCVAAGMMITNGKETQQKSTIVKQIEWRLWFGGCQLMASLVLACQTCWACWSSKEFSSKDRVLEH